MSNLKEIAKLRLQLLDNGYSPIASYDKRCFMKGWPTVVIDETIIEKVWARKHRDDGTAIRVENGLCVIDIDIDHRIIDDVCDAMIDTLDEDVEPFRLERRGKGFKLAWYVQTDDLFQRLHSRKWIAPGESADESTHCIEIFGGGSPRYFGSFGPHTKDDDGKTKITYQWQAESPLDVPLNALPIITKSQLFAMIDAAERELELQGFTVHLKTKTGEGVAGKVYDLTEDMTFDLQDGQSVSLAELEKMVKDGYSGRCSADWLEGETSGNTSRCIIGVNGANHLTVWESAESMTHMSAAIAPVNLKDRVDRLAEKLRERKDKRRTQLRDGDDHISGAVKLLSSYAYMPTAKAPVVPLWSVTDDEMVTLTNFRTQMMPYCGIEVGPKGGEKKINPVDVWLSNANRVIVSGQRMRPDCERPTFEEHDRLWLNTYRPPDLGSVDGGTADGGIALIEQLVPDERERKWFMQWLAYKWRNPEVPGPAIIMVARDFGTGRGTFASLLKLIFGDRYVKNVPFKIFSGQNYQSQYNEWALNSLFAIVNESSATGDMSSHKSKHDVYEHLKETVEPRPVEKMYIIKGEGSIEAISSTTCMIMTNNIDAIPIPEDDRRFAVLTNGEKRDDEFWGYINDWMSFKSNIAAFGGYLDEVSLEGYNPFAAPIRTVAKEEMADMNKTQLDRLLYEALNDMDGYFVAEQVIKIIAERELQGNFKLPDHWQEISRREILMKSYVVRYPNGRKVSPQFNGVRHTVLHGTARGAKSFENTGDIRFKLGKNGNVFGVSSVSVTQKLKDIK